MFTTARKGFASLCLGLLFAAVAAVAQNQDRNIQALLANDDAIAAVRQQLASKQITNLEYTRQAQQLGKDRNQILSHYDRAGQRQLITLYRAAAKDKQIREAEAKRQAEAAARAQAEAAKQQQAADTAAAVAQAFDADAREYTRLAIRHDEILYRAQIQQATPAERAELPRLEAAGKEIKGKHARESAAFDKRLAELSKEMVQPARQSWITASFPSASAIASAYRDDGKRYAALSVIDRILWEQAGQPQSEATAAKIAGYRAAMKQIDTKTANSIEVFRLVRDNHFRAEVLTKFAPAFAGPAVQGARQDEERERIRAANQKRNLIVVLTVLLMLAVPGVKLFLGESRGKPQSRHADPKYAFQLPEALSSIRVFRKWLHIGSNCGRITNEKVWTETHTTHYYNPGQSYTVNGVVYSTPGNYTSSTTSITYHKYDLETPDGGTGWAQFSGNNFPAAVGEVITAIHCDGDILFAYNHSEGKYVAFTSTINQVLRLERGRWLWGATVLIAAAGGYIAMQTYPAGDIDGSHAFWAMPMVLGFFSLIYIIAAKIGVYLIRRVAFRVRWQPKFREWLEQSTPLLNQVYSRVHRAGADG